jgi:nitrate reductase NapE component
MKVQSTDVEMTYPLTQSGEQAKTKEQRRRKKLMVLAFLAFVLFFVFLLPLLLECEAGTHYACAVDSQCHYGALLVLRYELCPGGQQCSSLNCSENSCVEYVYNCSTNSADARQCVSASSRWDWCTNISAVLVIFMLLAMFAATAFIVLACYSMPYWQMRCNK